MTLKELDDKLNSPGFQDPENGDLCYNFLFTNIRQTRNTISADRYRSLKRILSAPSTMWMCLR